MSGHLSMDYSPGGRKLRQIRRLHAATMAAMGKPILVSVGYNSGWKNMLNPDTDS
jgi:hypothetical protein